MLSRRTASFCIFLVACGFTPAQAQTNVAYGELYGVVTSPGGGSIPGATVTLENAATGLKRQTTTNLSGAYRFLLISPGSYEVRVERSGFRGADRKGVDVFVGQATALDVRMELGQLPQSVLVEESPATVDTQQAHPASFMGEAWIRDLPIDRRDFLTFVLLAPGVSDAKGLAGDTDLRVKQTPTRGLSFFGSNGRGNTVTVDGGEMNDGSGGVRSTISQEAVQEFQTNRGNYSAEIGGGSGGAINIVSKSGTNAVHGSVFLFARNEVLDAGDPFARVLQGSNEVRIKPPSKRQQFGATLGMPLRRNHTFLFASFEGLVRRESSVVSILTDNSIFGPTPQQEAFLTGLPADRAANLRALLTSPPSTVQLFQNNSGVFPFSTDSYRGSLRLDHYSGASDQFFFRLDVPSLNESNANLQALVGASRGLVTNQFDPTAILGWTHVFSSRFTNEARVQASYRHFVMQTREPYGPEIRIAGYGVFNRDIFLPSRNIERRFEIKDNVNMALGRHVFKFGGQAWIRSALADSDVFFPGRFTFGELPGSVIDPSLPPNFTITALQAFNLGLPQTSIIGQGASVVKAIYPYFGFYVADTWRVSSRLTLDLGLRYEVDFRKPPLLTDKNNVGPRFAFAWNPDGAGKTVVRGGYGIFYATTNFAIDYTVNALNSLNGYRQIAQAFSSILVPGLASAPNIFTTLRQQNVIGIPTPTRSITPQDLAQFGITFPHTGPLPPFTVLFENSKDFASPYSEQASLGVERQLARDFSLEIGGMFVRTLKLPRARDANLLPAPSTPRLASPSGRPPPVLWIRCWRNATGLNPLLAPGTAP